MISFIIPAYNEEEYLPHCINSIRETCANIEEPYEIIVVNNCSTDKTAQIALSLNCKVFFQAERGIAKTRNLGAKNALGDKIIFIDADSILNIKILQTSLSKLKQEKVCVSSITSFAEYPGALTRLVWFYNLLSRIFSLGVGQYIAIKKEAFEKVNGFDDNYYAFEEIDLLRRLKKQYGRQSVEVLWIPVESSNRKFTKESNNDILKFITQLIAAINGRPVGKNKSELSFWYKDESNEQKTQEGFEKKSKIKNALKSDATKNVWEKSNPATIFIATLLFFDVLFDLLNIEFSQSINGVVIFIIFAAAVTTSINFSQINNEKERNQQNTKILQKLFLLGALLLLVEAVGQKTGLPFGQYTYNYEMREFGLFGVPLFIPLAWLFIILSAKSFFSDKFNAAILIILIDLILEKFAEIKQLWIWNNPTVFTAPVLNYLSWFVISVIGLGFLQNIKLNVKSTQKTLILLLAYFAIILGMRMQIQFVSAVLLFTMLSIKLKNHDR
ncbi:carotenoid biosynthesis protein [Candidatus Nomurabacteria bacterium]|uniref:Carotenoid biosynthesis protein n=1 Tax=candidate division WWE3 bacterium TaxID=2053526 RepID=A0A955IWN1_UNCKA|nr:carotenoid biosynthesis protein [candidate division WWE3 bacterium]MCB9823876.1 carotenoid biosynthesis protein [Candidatus Nomurabacteria bacterium]MCB9827144.1 carotenoid biosynthesis protein [Candidatus Nomurabacteria bacterium]MCB9827815.1 carotenoid biosynthesis protein [Candidatus Nomurabacteria bacterium]